MQKKYKYYLLAFTLFFISIVRAQVFPVNITPQVIPPYSLQLSEYRTSTSEKLLVNLLLTDITRSNLEIRLKLFIENNAGLSIQSTDVVIGATPIFLDGGVPLRLSNIDLQSYFALQNLTGITPQKYGTSLPEGMYRFCFEAYEVISGKQISRKSCAMAYLVLNDPPFLNLPNQGEQVVMRDPQNIIFQWTPRHLNATNVEYEFTLTELWDSKMDPQALFLASQPIYQTNTFATTLLYGPSETGLLPNKSYAWRVRAMVRDGISESSVFKNDGYSEVYNFTYSGDCAEPAYILAEAKNTTSEKIYWQGVNHLKYNVQYRKKDVENAIWFEGNAVNQNISIYNLEPGTTYEFRVGGQCMENGAYTYSQIYEFTTTIASNDAITYNCGITPEIEITNQDKLQALIKEDVFTAGDFPVVVEEIRQSGGTFSGEGYIIVPYLSNLSVKVKFDDIGINTDYQLIEGIVETVYDENSGGIVTIDDILNDDKGDNDTASNDDSGEYDPEDPYSIPNNNNEPVNEIEPTVVVDSPVTGNDNNNTPVVDNGTNTLPIDNPTNIDDDPDLDNDDVTVNNPEENNTTTGGSPGGDDTNISDDNINAKILFESDNTLYSDGETIDIQFNYEELPVVFQLENYPEETKEFKWQIFEGKEDQTVNFIIGQGINADQDTFSLDLKKRSGSMRLRITYDDKQIEVNLNITKKSFDFVELTATHNEKRTAKSGETLYVVNDWSILKGLGNKEIKYEADLDPDPKSNEYYNDITWSFDEQNLFKDRKSITRKLKFNESLKEINGDMVSEPVMTTVSAGYPENTEKSVEVRWIRENRIRRDWTKKFKPVLSSFDKFNKLSEILKNKGFPCELSFFENYKDLIKKSELKFIGETYKEESKESRFYNDVWQFRIMASGFDVVKLACGPKFKVPIPFIPDPEVEFKFEIKAGLRGTVDIKYEKEAETGVKYFNNSSVSGGGYINPAIKLKTKVLSKEVSANIDANSGIRFIYPYKGDPNVLALTAYISDIYGYVALDGDGATSGSSYRHHLFQLDVQSEFEIYKFNIKELFEEEGIN
ncbi:fibronectin type III domain-containing protein [Aquimarina sp. AU58]|uniref:fibronectin type III domain-containing protein n=1 Tax=Aquimarina sp. AU58 TaxID=1874112 RepID=UPI00135C89D9|nr:fibronectin type III domain-containing protein [Aquimarina sp. AU58]